MRANQQFVGWLMHRAPERFDRQERWLFHAGMYNGMITPLVPFAIRGVVWYQGESMRRMS